MKWGFLSVNHIISLVVAVGIITGLFFLLRNRRDRTKQIVLGILSFSGIAAIIFNLLVWNSPLEYLPLHLCSLNALVLPVAVFTRSKTLNNLLLLWSFGALFALILNLSVADASIFSWVFLFYYFPLSLTRSQMLILPSFISSMTTAFRCSRSPTVKRSARYSI